ncbi:hypothetical protein EIB18_15480 [Caulobacter vibrioides]|uniref:hypothetical protein n=1 Tax=Caulobacter vibrioides TaxID=155892 RepID=UPI000BB47C9C|nr:hypothetical protein [Caulobacter vibrioides]ATC25815.1 hypothetical protein CA608_15395 [Caulobacter vibrioides]AZH13959.1 hypothetical protein EIB18_15480 [Caulobacter vibrioides]PLR13600.1 hypothetical protein CVUC_06465 [Caulobacter vibrioides]
MGACMKPIGSDGKPIPTPPSLLSFWEVVGVYGRLGLWLGALFIGAVGIFILMDQPPFVQMGWSGLVQQLAAVVALIAIVIPALQVFFALTNRASGSLRPGRYGRLFERRFARFTPQQIEDILQDARAILATMSDSPKRRAWARWVEWLEQRSNLPLAERSGLKIGVYHPRRSKLWIDGAGVALVGALGSWLIWDQRSWMGWAFLGVLGSLFTWGLLATLTERLELSDDSLSYYAFRRQQWSVPRQHVALREAGSSEYQIYDVRTGRLLGEVKGETFGADIVEALADLFPPWLGDEVG